MERTEIKKIKNKVGEEVKIYGFIHTIRDQGGIKFLLVRDITGIVQCVVTKKSPVFERLGDLSNESVVEITGKVKEVEQAPDGFEVKVEELEILSKADPELPIPVIVEKFGEETEYAKRMDWRWIDLRKQEKVRIFKVWTELEKGVRKFFEENDFLQIYAPTFMSAPSESGADVFEVGYFEKKAYLAQSPQFYKQMAMAAGFEKVFMIGPVYRAELSFTTRHTTEFTGWDFEVSYINSHSEVMDLVEDMFRTAFGYVNESMGLKLELPKQQFPRITMAEAKEKLAETGIASKADYDISPEEERELGRIMKEETGSDFVFLTDYPIEARPFYHMRYEDKPGLTKSYDLLYKGIEVITGAQREHRYDILVNQAKEKGMDIEQLSEYLNFFKYGCPPHGGAGIGPGRIIMKMLDLPSVKEATFLPRDVKRITP